ncbi:MAG: SAM hydroxide adenosyltransferase [Verrucomicrobiota bacterium]
MTVIRVIIIFLTLTLSLRADVAVHEGVLDGAPYKVAIPEEWSGGSVFFIVNGWRPAEAPHIADLDIEDPLVKRLLQNGWAVARTAFKENGVDPVAHTVALRDLRDWIGSELGVVENVVLEGESTAGTLVLRIAEKNPELADGVIAMSAYINLEDPESDDFLKADPKIPAILMSNITEIEAPVAYVTSALDAPVRPTLRPVLRPGHVNLNWVERWEALKALKTWFSSETAPPIEDGTRSVPQRQTGTRMENDSLINKVTSVNPFYGNALLGFHPDELKASGIEQGKTFDLKVNGKSWSIYYGESYSDVPLGEWIAFPNADDQILLARNHKSAVETAGLFVGSEVMIIRQE